jgi:hypothetical protein
MDEMAFARIGSALAGITASAPSASGSFSYTPEALRDLITEWSNLEEDYRSSVVNAAQLAQIDGPGTEYASKGHGSVASSAGQAYLDSLQERVEYCQKQVDKLQDTLNSYLGVEQGNTSMINRAGSSQAEAPQGGI